MRATSHGPDERREGQAAWTVPGTRCPTQRGGRWGSGQAGPLCRLGMRTALSKAQVIYCLGGNKGPLRTQPVGTNGHRNCLPGHAIWLAEQASPVGKNKELALLKAQGPLTCPTTIARHPWSPYSGHSWTEWPFAGIGELAPLLQQEQDPASPAGSQP